MHCQTQCETKMLPGKSRFKHSGGEKLSEHLLPFSELTLLLTVSLFIVERTDLEKLVDEKV